MIWRVVATQPGFHNQILRQVGEVFDLLGYEDGSFPPKVRYLPKKDKNGAVIADEYTEEVLKDKQGNLIHRDFAEDTGTVLIRKGPQKGDTMRFGWMRRVPEKVQVGIYPENTDFWSGTQLPPPQFRSAGAPPDPRRIHAPVLDVLPPEPKDADIAA